MSSFSHQWHVGVCAQFTHYASSVYLLASTVGGYLVGCALPTRLTKLLHPMITTAFAANISTVLLGSLTGAGFQATLRGYLTKVWGGTLRLHAVVRTPGVPAIGSQWASKELAHGLQTALDSSPVDSAYSLIMPCRLFQGFDCNGKVAMPLTVLHNDCGACCCRTQRGRELGTGS